MLSVMAWAWAGGQPGHPRSQAGVVGEIVGAAGQRHGAAGVGQQHADSDAGWLGPADADVVQWFLDHAVQCFAGEPGEVDGYVVALECLLDKRPDAY